MKSQITRVGAIFAIILISCGFVSAGTVTWTGGSGDWSNATNWSTGALPGPNDDVVINPAATITVTHSTGSNTVHSVENSEAFVLSGGSLTVTTTIIASNTFTLSGGTLKSAKVITTNGASLVVSSVGGSTLNGVTVNGTVDVGNTFDDAYLTVTNGLTLMGTMLVGNPTNYYYGNVGFAGSQTLGGNGTVVFGDSYDYYYYYYYYYNALRLLYGGTTLTIGPGITVRGQSGAIGYSPAYGGLQDVSVVNQGTISDDVSGGIITVTAQGFTNQGLAQGINGGTLVLNGRWRNPGTLVDSGGTINFGGNFTWTNVGTLNLTNATIEISGVLTNTGVTLDLTNALWVLDAGTILGGTIAATNGQSLIIDGSATLNGVTVDGVLDVGNTYSAAVLTVTNGLTLNGTALVGNPTNDDYGSISFAGSQALGGNGTIVFGDSYYYYYYEDYYYDYNALWLLSSGTTLTIGPGITVHGFNGAIGYSSAYGGSQAVSVINQGTISADVSGGTIGINAQPFINQGLAQGINGGTLELDGQWNNPGTLVESGGTIDFGGDFTWTNVGTLNLTNGTIYISGVLTNTGATFDLTNVQWGLESGGTILGGTVLANNGQSLIVNGSATLNGVTVDGTLDVGNTYNDSQLTVTNGLVLNGTALVGNPTNSTYGSIIFAGSQTLGGNGTVVFGDSYYYYYDEYNYNALRLLYGGTTLTIGPGITVRGQYGAIGYSPAYGGPQNVSVVNQGTISADVSGGIITITAEPFTNQGLAQGINGGTLVLDGQWNNTGTLVESGGSIDLGGDFSSANVGTLNQTNAVIYISGVLTNTGATLDLGNVRWGLTGGGTIFGGTIMASTNQPLIVNGSGALNGVTVDGALDVGNTYDAAALTVTNGLTLNGTALVGNPTNSYYGSISFAGSQTLGGNGTVVFGNAYYDDYYYYYYYYDYDYNSLWLSYGGTSLTIGPGITVRGENGGIGYSGYYGGPQDISVTNQGTISDDVPGGVIGIDAEPFVNQKLVQALTDCSVVFSSSNDFTAGTLGVAIGGPSDYGAINFAGNVVLSPIQFSVSLSDGYVPAMGSSFTVMNYGSASGVLGSLELPSPGVLWQAGYGSTSFALTVTNTVVPAVSIINPTNDSIFIGSSNISITAQATDNYGSIAKVDFFEQGYLIQEALNPPYSVVWSNVPPGLYWLTAKATDTSGNVGTSLPVMITVLPTVPGTNYVWLGYDSSDWSTAGNWSPAGVPGPADGATIANGGEVTLSQNVNVQFLALASGTIYGSSSLTINGSFDWGGGSLFSPIIISSNAVMEIAGSGTLSLYGALTNEGTVNWAGPGNLELYNDPYYNEYAGGINNLPGAIFNVQNNQQILCWCGGGEYFNNAGLVCKSPGTGTTLVDVPFTNTGTIYVESGTLAMQSQFNGTGGTLSFLLNGPNDNGSMSFAYPLAADASGVLQASLQSGYLPVLGAGFTLLTYPSASGSFTNVQLPPQIQWTYPASSTAFSIIADSLQTNSSSYTWTGGVSTDWTNPANWNPPGVPNGSTGEIINVTNGTINLSASVTINGQLNWLGGTFEGSSLTIGTNGLLNIDGVGEKYLQSMLTNSGTVIWTGGDIEVSNCLAATAPIVNDTDAVWVIWSDQTLASGCIGAANGWENFGTLVKWGYANTTSIQLPFENNGGALEVDQGTLAFDQPVSFNGATLTGPGAITFNGGWQNNQTLTVDGTTVTLAGSWTNSGTIDATNAIFNLEGAFTLADLGTFNSVGGSVNVMGDLDNTGTTLTLGTGSSWALNGGVINGGTITTTNAGGLMIENNGAGLNHVTLNGALLVGSAGVMLNGVTINGTLDVGNSVNEAFASVTNGLVLNGVALIGNPLNDWNGGLQFLGNETLSGSATIVFGIGCNALTANSGGALTIGPNIRIRGQNGNIGGVSCFWDASGIAVTNYGDISCDVSGGTINIEAQPFANFGWVQGVNGGSLVIDSLQNNPGATVLINEGNLTLNGNNGPWNNLGTINATNATLNLGGALVTSANTLLNLGTFNRDGGMINVTGFINNSNQTLALTGNLAAFALSGGGIFGGTVLANSGESLIVNGSATLNGVTVDGALDVGNTYDAAALTVTNGLILNGTGLVGNPTNYYFGSISFAGSQTLGGNGTVVFGDSYYYYYYDYDYNALRLVYDGTTLTIGPGMTVRGDVGAIGYSAYYGGPQDISVVNQGTISDDVSGGIITITAQPFTNQGLAQGINGGTLAFDGQWNNSGTLVDSGGTIDFGGDFAWANVGTLNLTNGTIFISGVLTNTGATLNLTNGQLGLEDGGTILGGTVLANNSQSLIVNGNATLNGVTVDGMLDVGNTYSGAALTVMNGLTLNGTALVGNPTNSSYGSINFAGSQTLGGDGTVLFGDSYYSYYYYYNSYDYNALRMVNDGTALTIGPEITVHGQNGAIGYSSYYGGPQDISVFNEGTVAADVSGGTINVDGESVTNAGNLGALQGAILSWGGDLNFDGPQFVTSQPGGTLVVGGNVLGTPAGPGAYNPEGTVEFSSGSHQLQAMSTDVGNVPSGYVNNFTYGGISLESGANVSLENLTTNTPGGLPPCVYVNSLTIAANAVLNLNGLNLYCRLAAVAGSVTNGAVIQAPNGGGPIVPASPTPAAIQNAGAYADWTFYGQAGQHVVVAVDPGSASVIPPQLGYAFVQLYDPSTNLLGQASNSVAGQTALLNNVTLPADGTYSVRVSAPANQAESTGNYQVAVWIVTPFVGSLVVNQNVNGQIPTPYSLDQWNFSASAGQQIAFDLINESAPGVAFSLTGPNGWGGFTNLLSSSGLVTLPYSGTYTLSADGTGGQYDINFAFQLAETAETNVAPGTAFNGQLVASGQAQLIAVTVTNPSPMRISLSKQYPATAVALYVKYGSPPTPSDYDYSYQGPDNAQTEDIIIPYASAGTWYVLVYANYVPELTSYTLTATQSSVIFESFSPSTAGSGVNTVLSLSGAGFDSNLVVQLDFTTNSSTVAAQSVNVISPANASAIFPSNTIPPGPYTVCVSDSGDQVCLTNILTVIQGGLPDFHATFSIPSIIGYHEPSTIYVKYSNTGTAPMPAPLLVLSGTQSGNPGPIMTLNPSLQSEIGAIEQKLLSNFNGAITTEPAGFQSSIQILAGGKVPGLLQPGESNTVSVYYAGWLEPWDFSRPPLIFTLGVHTADDTTPIDWANYATNSQPSGVSTAQWANLLSGLETTLGGTWGSYVSGLDQMVNLASPLDGTAYDASELFDTVFEQMSGFGNSGISGAVIDITTNEPVANVQVVLRQQPDTADSVDRSLQTDGSGEFSINNLPPGTYEVDVTGYSSPTPYVYTLTDNNLVKGVTLNVSPLSTPVSPPPLIMHTNESNPSLAIDSSGTPHMVWVRGGEIWHAYFYGTNWVATGSLPGAIGTDPKIAAAPNLIGGASPGLIISWQALDTNSSALYYCVATNLASGSNSLVTTTPQLLSDGETNILDLDNQALALTVSPGGQVIAVWQKVQTSITDDTDLYFKFVSLSPSQLLWPDNSAQINSSQATLPLVDTTSCSGVQFEFEGLDVPTWVPEFGGEYKLQLGGQVCANIKGDCGGVQTSGNLSAAFDSPFFAVSGTGQAQADYKIDKNQCAYVLDSSGLQFGITAVQKDTVEWEYKPVIGVKLKWGGALQYGINVTAAMSWIAAPDYGFPDSGSVSIQDLVGGKIGGELTVFGTTAKLEGSADGTLTGKFDPSKANFWTEQVEGSVQGQAQFGPLLRSFKYSWAWPQENASSAISSLLVPGAQLSDNGFSIVTTVAPLVGTTNVYGGNPVMTNVASNVVQDGNPSLTVTPAGNVYLAWTEDSDDTTNWLGNRVFVSTLQDGGWTSPIEVPDSRGFNSDVKITSDPLGNPLLVWAMASNAGLTLTNTADQVQAAMGSNNVVFSTYDGVNWSSPAIVTALPGTEDNINLGQTADGQTLAAWVNDTVDTNSIETDTIYTATWDGTNWTTSSLVATSSVSGPISISVVGGATTVFWSANYVDTNNPANGTNNPTIDSSLFSSSLELKGLQWSAPQQFTAGDTFALTQTTPALAANIKPAGIFFPTVGSPPSSCCVSNPPPTNQPPPMPTNCPTCDTNNTTPVSSEDPNGKIGPAGYGPPGWILDSSVFPYTINFENASNATAPAQMVTINDPLSTNLDWSTFALGEIAFGTNFVTPPPNCQYFATNVTIAVDGLSIIVQIQAGIDLDTGNVYASFNSINAANDLAPPVNVGFLPPEDGSGRGQGYVSYFLQPVSGLAQGTQITNVAYIQFDENPVLATDLINDENPALGIDTNAECLVTIDNVPPASQVNSLPASEPFNFTVTWTGTDNGPGIASYDIYVSSNGGPWTVWLSDTTNTSAVFAGSNGQTYGFYSVATDELGLTETNAATAEAETFVNGCGFSITPEYVAIPAKAATNTVTVTSHGDCLWTVINTNTWINILSGGGITNSGIVKYSVTANTNLAYRLASLIVAGQSFTVLQKGTDVFTPAFTIKAPVPNQLWSNAVFTASGTAGDNRGITNVWYQFNNGAWSGATPTNNWTNWTATLNLTPGTNVFSAYAMDFSGNTSPTNTIRFSYIVNSPLRLQITGKGTVTGATNGQILQIGRNYSLTATAASGFALTNWSGGTVLHLSVLTTKPTVTFMMQSNLVMQANFVDALKPFLKITNPVPSVVLVTNINQFAPVMGVATDDEVVASVDYSFNGSGYTTAATSGIKWSSMPLSLMAGTNVFSVYAQATNGNYSATDTLDVVMISPNPLTVVTNGRGMISPANYTNGVLLDAGRAYSMTATAGSGFMFTNWIGGIKGAPFTVYTNKPTVTFLMETNLVMQANFVDALKPFLKITNPIPSVVLVTNVNQFAPVMGVATDDEEVASVDYSFNGSGYTTAATAGIKWSSAPLSLMAGTNVFSVYAQATNGNYSATDTLDVVMISPNPLTVVTNGRGTITPANYTNGVLLDAGREYSMTAAAASGFIFTNWTGGIKGTPFTVYTNKPVVSFVMETNLVMQANFVDTLKPFLKITNAVSGMIWTNSSYPVMGVATDDEAIASVNYSLDGGSYTQAMINGIQWTASLTTLAEGTNYFSVYAQATNGNLSVTDTVTIIRRPSITIFPIATNEDIAHPQAEIAFDGSNYLVVFSGNQPGGEGAVGQFVSQSGNLIGAPLALNPGGQDDPPYLDFDGTNYLVAWADYSAEKSGIPLKGLLVSPNGATGAVTQLSESITVTNFSTIAHGNGVYFLVWSDSRNYPGPDSIYGAMISASGENVTGDFEISSNGDEDEVGQGAAAFDGTNFLAVWSSETGKTSISGALIDTSGHVMTNMVIYTNSTPTGKGLPCVLFDGTKYLVLFNVGVNSANAGAYHVLGRFVTTGGGVLTNQMNLTSDVAPQLAAGADFDAENYLISWNQGWNPFAKTTSATVNGRFFNFSGNSTTAEFPIFVTQPGNEIPLWAPVLFDGTKFVLVGGFGQMISPAPDIEFTNGVIYGAFVSP